MDVYMDLPGIKVSVNCILISFDEENIRVLLSRDLKDGEWLLPGRCVGLQESAEASALRVLEDCNCSHDVQLEQLHVFSDVDKKVGDPSIAIAYVGLVRFQTESSIRHSELKWFSLSELPTVQIRHKVMVDAAREHLKCRAARQPFGRELLQERFTIPQLRCLYESVYGRELDQRNFAKKILSLGILIKLEEKDMLSSKKGAYYFMFNPHTYGRRYSASLYHNAD
jgi:8-oxo-dGTP diphosphatase